MGQRSRLERLAIGARHDVVIVGEPPTSACLIRC
jgi:hypothetical protein